MNKKEDSLKISIQGGTGVCLWVPDKMLVPVKALDSAVLQLPSDKPVVIGRQQEGTLDYLDPAYRPMSLTPDASSSSVLTFTADKNNSVSRGHLLLKRTAAGIVLVNGVPQPKGGIRPPTNGTFLLEPENRWMEKGEEYLLRGAVKVQLPSGAVITICPTEGA